MTSIQNSKQIKQTKLDCYQLVKGPNNKVCIVGFGSYGEVKLAKNTQTDELVAIKFMYGRNAKQEIDVHHKLTHPNIIKLLKSNYDKEKNATYMVLQYASGGTLLNKIKFGYGQLMKHKIKKYFKDICKAVQYLHSLKYMHRDIKPENILLTHDDHAKLCDFGVAAILQFRSTLCGTYQYMAPEMIQEKPYDYKIDIWALGILLFELIQGTPPFKGQTRQDVINQMKKPIVFSHRFQKDQIDLIKKILRVNAENRPNATTILQHPYFGQQKQIHQQKQLLINQVSKFHQKLPQKYETSQTQTEILAQFNTKIATGKQQNKQFLHYLPSGIKSIPVTNTTNIKNQNIYYTNNNNQINQNSSSQNICNKVRNTSTDLFIKQQQKCVPSFLTTTKPNTKQCAAKTNIKTPNSNNYGYHSTGTLQSTSRSIVPWNNINNFPTIPIPNLNLLKKS